MNPFAILLVVCLITASISIGLYGLHFSRVTSDFFAAAKSVSTLANASAMAGEYLSAASFLGIAAVVMLYGIDMLWYPVGFTSGFLVLLLLVAAPLRRSGAYTLPDFAETRMESRFVRRIASALVIIIGWLYMLPQMQAAGLTLRLMTGASEASGGLVVALVVGLTVAAGGTRSISLVQTFQYWLKLIAIAVPALLIFWAWERAGGHTAASGTWSEPLAVFPGHEYPIYSNVAIVIATLLGTMGLPHVLVRLYAIPDGRAARRTTLVTIGLISLFYLFPPMLGALGRHYMPGLTHDTADGVVLLLPERVFPGAFGQMLGALAAAGAFAAFMATASGLTLSIAGVMSQDLLQKRMGALAGFRTGAAIALVVPLLLLPVVLHQNLAEMTLMAFSVAASTFCPLLVLGIWWKRLSTAGAIAGLVAGGGTSVLATAAGMLVPTSGVLQLLLTQSAVWTVPLAFICMIAVSLVTSDRIPAHASITLGRLHTPDKFVI